MAPKASGLCQIRAPTSSQMTQGRIVTIGLGELSIKLTVETNQ